MFVIPADPDYCRFQGVTYSVLKAFRDFPWLRSTVHYTNSHWKVVSYKISYFVDFYSILFQFLFFILQFIAFLPVHLIITVLKCVLVVFVSLFTNVVSVKVHLWGYACSWQGCVCARVYGSSRELLRHMSGHVWLRGLWRKGLQLRLLEAILWPADKPHNNILFLTSTST